MPSQLSRANASAQPSPTPAPAEGHAVALNKTVFLTTRTGFQFQVRPVEPLDEPELGRFFSHVTDDDMRFRFLSPLKTVGHDMLRKMIDVDHDHKEDYLAFDSDGETIIASAVVAADPATECAEVAMAMRGDYKHKGVGWTFLEYVVAQQRKKGVRKLQSIESRDNHAVIDLEREMGFTASSYPGDASLVLLEFDLAAPSTQSRSH